MKREELRKVKFSYTTNITSNEKEWKEGYFHQWVFGAEIVHGTYVSAIVEDEQGCIHSIDIDRIKFINE